MSRVDYEYEFDPDAANNTAASVYRLARESGTRILDLGSGPGIVAGALATADGRSVTCVDSDEELLAVAKARGVSRTIVADLNDPSWFDLIAAEQFDVVILADVLEHLYDPGRLLSSLYNSTLIAEGGRLIVSIPNAAHEGALAELVSGHFTYTATGILDETHIRFFTLDSFRALVESAGFFISHVERTLRTIEQTSFRDRLPEIPAGLRQLVAEHNPEVRVYQYVMQLVPARERDVLAAGRAEIEALESKVASLQVEISRVQSALTQSQASAEAKRNEAMSQADQRIETLRQDLTSARANSEVEGREAERLGNELRRLRSSQVKRLLDLDSRRRLLVQELDQVRSDNVELETRSRALERRIELIYESNTWRVGDRVRRLVAPFNRRSTGKPEQQHPAKNQKVAEAVQAKSTALTRHPLAEEYLEEVASGLPSTGKSLGFAVYTSDFDQGRGDIFVAAGIGRYLRRLGISPVYLPENLWYDLPEGVDWVIAMLPSFSPARAPKRSGVIGWVRNEVDNWLDHPELDLFDAILCSSELTRATIAERYGGPTGLLPIGVDLELFAPPSEVNERVGVVSTVNQWGRERDIYRALRSSPITFPLGIYGKAVGLPAELTGFHQGLADYFCLPGLYWGVRLVLDDFNHSTVGWGAVNSRIFEAIAAGALPITNSSLGLSELGLGEVPVFTEPEELNPIVLSLLNDPESDLAIVERLRRVVEEKHSFDRRARELSSFLDSMEEASSQRRVLGFFPDYRITNPYQEMLYSSRREYATAVMPLQEYTDLTAMIPGRNGASRIFHLHWTAPITGPADTESGALVRVDEFLQSVQLFKQSGGRLVWTVHNAMPHEVRFEDVELHLRNELAMQADLIHVMCDATLSEVDDLYPLPEDRTVVIPHSGYVGVYPDAADRETARTNLGLDHGDIALLALGGIRPYKRLDWLLDALDKALELQPRLRLIVAGKPGRFPGLRDLQERCDSHPAVIANFNEIASNDLQHFYKAADVAVLTHGAALNSGALFLAYSFGCPVIAPRLGCLAETLVEAASIGFDPADFDSFVDALTSAERLSTVDARRAARAFAESRPVADMSGAFLKVLDTLDR